MSVLKISDLHKTYKTSFYKKNKKVLNGLSFSVPEGTVTGFLGGNGAGKTTAIKCILDLCIPDSGEILFFDKKKISLAVKEKIGFLPERPYFYNYLTGLEFLKFYGKLSKMSNQNIIIKSTSLLKKLDLYHYKDQLLGSYSKGMLQKIGIAQALIHDPDLLILDEPMSGLDPDGRHYISEIIKDTAKKGKSIFFSSHLLDDVEKISQNLVILKESKLLYEGQTEELLKTYQSGYELHYSLNSEKHILKLKELSLMQSKIEELIKKGAIIFEFKAVRPSLEEVFVNMALNTQQTHSKHIVNK
ncbi:MAG: ABC transporter ATP-binding protein [Bdellovibrionales bacterium]|nr:ABC transporter ATP-binding protein [Bdellovibrionales bacterium]